MTAREEILGRIQRALPAHRAESREAEYASIARGYGVGTGMDREAVIALFTERLHDYNALVHRCVSDEVAATIASILASREKKGLLIPPDLPAEWLPSGFAFTQDRELTYADLDKSEGVLTGCAVAIALSGTIVVRHSPEQGRRALTLVPDYHLCVVHVDQIAETVPEGIRRMTALLPAPLTTISGPSATSDIEMIRVKGVHGPRTLEVILVQ